MATSYTTLLGLALPATGELSGTWGDTVNNYISNYIDAAVAGAVTVTTDTTLTKTTGSSLGATSSQYAIIIASPASANITITAPAASKSYIINNTSATYTVKIVGAGPTTGVTLLASEKAIVAWNGSDFVKVASTSASTINAGTLAVANGGTGLTTTPANGALDIGNGTGFTRTTLTAGTGISVTNSAGGITITNTSTSSGGTVTSVGGTGTVNGITLTGTVTSSGNLTLGGTLSGVSLTTQVSGTLPVANGGTNLTSFTANGVVYASSSSALTTGSALTFDGTTQTLAAATGYGTFRVSGVYGGYFNIYNSTGTNIGSFGSENGGDMYLGTRVNNPIVFLQNATEQMRLTSTGLGIGTTSPAYRLQLTNTAASNFVSVVSVNTGTAGLLLGDTDSATVGRVQYENLNNAMTFFTNGSERVRLSSAGGLSVGTTADPGAGAIYATGNITAYYSDARLKTVSGTIENALDKVSKLKGVYYTNNDVAKQHGYDSIEVQVGVLAQDVDAVLPEIVKAAPFDLDQDGNSKSGENYKTVQYERLVPLLIEAIKELEAKVKVLEAK